MTVLHHPTPVLTKDDKRLFEESIAAFEQAWHLSPPPDLSQFLPESPALRLAVLTELVAIDKEFRMQNGERPSDAEYRCRFPELCDFPTVVPLSSSTTASEPSNDKEHAKIRVVLDYVGTRQHASGGLGEILVLEDVHLNRRVAVKQLQRRWSQNRRAVRDFLQEAELTSRLEHPGIVPVHGLGETEDGRPCYSMRFVEGESLRHAIELYYRDEQDPSQRATRFRSLLASFVTVCNTVAYAHSRGVIHRDLKPDNIMLGPFGETLVVDWGLAKRLIDKDPVDLRANSVKVADAAVGLAASAGPLTDKDKPQSTASTAGEQFRPHIGSMDIETVAGQLIGTPAYLSPEQARGDHEQIGPATDVFGLGAILYTILTGVPPYHSATVEEALRRATRAEWTPPRQQNADARKKIPSALNAVCCRALAFNPDQRYATPLEMASDIERWLAGEPVTAMREPWRERAQRFLRRHRTAVAVLVVLAMVVPSTVAVASWFIAQERAHSEIARRTAEIRGETTQQVAEYLTRTFQSADPMPFDNPGFVGSEPRSSPAAMRRMLDSGAELLRVHLLDQPELRSQLLVSIGNSYRGLADYEKARAALEESYQIRQSLFGPYSLETLESQHYLARIAHDQGNYAQAEKLYRQVIAGRETLSPPQPLLVADTKYQLAWLLFYQPLGMDLPQFKPSVVEESIDLFTAVLVTREALLPPNHRDIGHAFAGRAAARFCLTEQEKSARGDAARAAEIFRSCDQERALGSFIVDYTRAERLRYDRQYVEAEAIYRQLLDQAREHFGPKHPMIAVHLWNMAGLYRVTQDRAGAERVISDARTILKSSISLRSAPTMVDGLTQYGDALREVGDKRCREVFVEALGYAKERPGVNAKYISGLEQRLAELSAASR